MSRLLRKKLVMLLGVAFLLTCAPSFVQAEDTPKQQTKRERREKRRKQRRDNKRADQKHSEQKREPSRTEPKRDEEKREPRREANLPKREDTENDARPPSRPADSARQAAQEAARGVDAEIVKEGDTSVKVMKFTGLDIEGRLKSPQLLYFVNRVRAEFERPQLPHRSFMPELHRSTERDPFP